MQGMDPDQTMERLHQALLEALRDQGKIPDDMLEQMLQNWKDYQNSELAAKINQLLERLAEEGYVSVEQPNPGQAEIMEREGKQAGGQQDGKTKFEVTDKALDFLGFKTLRDLLGSLGKSSFGRHDTRELSTGVESEGSSRRYEFGDTMNLDVNATLLSSIRRNGLKTPLELDYQDLQVHQCVPKLLRYGADARLQPQHDSVRRGPLHPGQESGDGAHHLIRTQYPGDTLHLVLFHDSAEECRFQNWRASAWDLTTPIRVKACAWRSGFLPAETKICARS